MHWTAKLPVGSCVHVGALEHPPLPGTRAAAFTQSQDGSARQEDGICLQVLRVGILKSSLCGSSTIWQYVSAELQK